MYVTRTLSVYQRSPSSCTVPEGPNSGILIIQDKESESRSFCGLFKDPNLRNLPFPQNKKMEFYYQHTRAVHEHSFQEDRHLFDGLLIPVMNRPLSSNLYYVINWSGLAILCSKEADMTTCCFLKFAKDVPPQPFDPNNAYQQFLFSVSTSRWTASTFRAISIAADGILPDFLRKRKYWNVYNRKLNNLNLTEANGLNTTLRATLPELKSSSSQVPVVVGKWYCPFIFIREGVFDFATQMKTSMYYEMTLEQKWEKIFECQKNHGYLSNNNCVVVDVSVQKQVILGGGEMARSVNVGDDHVMWVTPLNVGLSMAIVERVKWEQERGGFKWVGLRNFEDQKERVRKTEEFRGINEWRKFGCYVLVERFVLKRMDATLLLTWDFKHTHQITTKWE